MANKQDSNQTGLRYCQEESLKTLPASPIWKQFEPNSYGDFGASTTKTARNPINPSAETASFKVTNGRPNRLCTR